MRVAVGAELSFFALQDLHAHDERRARDATPSAVRPTASAPPHPERLLHAARDVGVVRLEARRDAQHGELDHVVRDHSSSTFRARSASAHEIRDGIRELSNIRLLHCLPRTLAGCLVNIVVEPSDYRDEQRR